MKDTKQELDVERSLHTGKTDQCTHSYQLSPTLTHHLRNKTDHREILDFFIYHEGIN
jgi:hypothetical protein